MKTHAGLVFLFVCLSGIGMAYSHGKKFAVLVSTTKSWLHYGHQSTLLHAYQTLIANGFPRANIITMFYDDIANHQSNREVGVIRNHPRGKNVYENVKKDYTGEKVTATNFIGVITGNRTMAQGPVLKSGPKDTLFVFIVGLSSYQYLTFPTGAGITSRKLTQTFEKLTKEKKFNKIFVSADVSYAQSLFEEFSPKSKVFVSASTNFVENPHAVYCYPENRLCYGSLYSVAWTQYSDRLRQLKSGAERTLYDQFNHVRAETPYTHVNVFGDLSVGRSQLQEFIAYKHEGKLNRNAAAAAAAASDSKLGLATPDQLGPLDGDGEKSYARTRQGDGENLPFHITNQSQLATIYDQLMDIEQKSTTLKNRNFIKETMKNIFDRLQNNGYENIRYEKAGNTRQVLSEHHSDVYEEAIREFHERCININENPFALREIAKLAHLCESGVNLNDLIAAMTATCTTKHKLTSNVY